MLKEIILETLGVKNVDPGELITPIDTFVTDNCFYDKNLSKNVYKNIEFEKGDIFEVQTVTPREIVAYVRNKDLYVIIHKYELKEFEDLA